MNFLAHALLAGEEPALIVGGVVGDWVKGALPAGLPADLARGVALHRAIDSHAETHLAFCRSRNRISPARRRYAGILVDIFYDHLLARDWPQPEPLSETTRRIYAHLADFDPQLPTHARRARQPNPLAGGEVEFMTDAAGFAEDFAEWFGDARRFVVKWIAKTAG